MKGGWEGAGEDGDRLAEGVQVQLRGCQYGCNGAGGGREFWSSWGALILDQGSGSVERLLAVGSDGFPDGELKLFAS